MFLLKEANNFKIKFKNFKTTMINDKIEKLFEEDLLHGIKLALKEYDLYEFKDKIELKINFERKEVEGFIDKNMNNFLDDDQLVDELFNKTEELNINQPYPVKLAIVLGKKFNYKKDEVYRLSKLAKNGGNCADFSKLLTTLLLKKKYNARIVANLGLNKRLGKYNYFEYVNELFTPHGITEVTYGNKKYWIDPSVFSVKLHKYGDESINWLLEHAVKELGEDQGNLYEPIFKLFFTEPFVSFTKTKVGEIKFEIKTN